MFRLCTAFHICCFLFCFTQANAQFPAACDRDKQCLGRALEMTVNAGRGAHFVEVSNYRLQGRTQQALTFEMWAKIDRLNNTRQYLGGIWGPATDNNDSWQLYIAQNDDLVFEVNGDGTKLRETDNSIARVPMRQYFGNWTHIAAVFDGTASTVSIYINGTLAAGPVSNPTYPARYLRPPEKADLKLLIGSINGFSDDPSINRTFRGQMDEIRMWYRVLTPQEIYCNSNRALAGNDNGLQLYYRCNDAASSITLCDATGKGNIGTMLSGAACRNSDRKKKQNVVITPSTVTDDIRCDFRKTYTFTITDTSVCGSTVTMRMENRDRNAFTLSQNSATLNPNIPVTFTVTVQSAIVGQIIADLRIIPGNDCGQEIIVPLRFTRTTELVYNRNRLNFDTLYAGCIDQKFKDTTFTICNTSDSLGQPRDVSITGFALGIPGVFSIVSPALPATLSPGQCTTVTVRFRATDTSALFNDTLKVLSTDRCLGGISIPLRGVVREIIAVTDESGRRRVDSARFGTECIGTLSNPITWVWRNLTARPITVDTMIIPAGFTGKRLRFPLQLDTNRGYAANFFRFFPARSGPYNDSVIIRMRLQGISCVIERKIYVSGRGYEAKVRWTTRLVDAGNVIVGQQQRIIASITNEAPDTLNIGCYLEVGEVFFFAGGRNTRIAPGQTVNIPIDFKPLKDSQYVDKLCLFEQRCFTTDCIEIRGRGILETFRFDPIIMRTENVLGCGDKDDTLDIVNISGSDQRLSLFGLTGGNGKYTIVSPNPLPADTLLPKDGRLRFVFNYQPNDTTTDRADRAFLSFTSLNVRWTAPLIGTSATPKIFLTPLTVYGTREVGDSLNQVILVENVSFLPVRVDSITVPNGFKIISMSRTLPDTLQPRDSMSVIVQFKPDLPQSYEDKMVAYSQYPCPMRQTATLRGRGVIVPLEAPISVMNWGYVRPCDCITRNLPLVNQSLVHEMTVDSLWIDSVGIPNGTPQFWTWKSTYSPNGTLPYKIPSESIDTVQITFCPRTPAEDKFITCAAQLNLKARGNGWQRNDYKVYLAGKRALLYKPEPVSITFPPTPVDTSLAPLFVRITIPGIDKNPEQYPVIIDSVSFEPNERVFTHFNANGSPFTPFTVKPGDTNQIRVLFRPRAPRLYTARMHLHTSSPCRDIDTTILVSGTGQANPYGLNFNFDNIRVFPDTFIANSCDTIRVPVYSSRDIPAELVDITCRIGHDTNELSFAGLESEYLTKNCFAEYIPTYTAAPGATGGTQFKLKNFCKVDSVRPFMIAKFISKTGNRANLPITVDSISFDTERTILYRIYAENDDGRVIIQKAALTVENPIQFDSVRVLDCADRTVSVRNTGDMPITIDSLPGLPPDVQITGSQPPAGTLIVPGDSMLFTLRYCPRRETALTNQPFYARTSLPCPVTDSNIMNGIGYAPDVQAQFSIGPRPTLPDTVAGILKDTVTVPLLIENDFSATYRGITYFLKSVSMKGTLQYNPRALKFLDISSGYKGMTSFTSPGLINMEFSALDSITTGILATARFVITVPDSVQSPMSLTLSDIRTDSLAFIDIIPLGNKVPVIVNGRCGQTTLTFTDIAPTLLQNVPNPVQGKARIEFSFAENTPFTLSLYGADGRFIKMLAGSEMPVDGGIYSVEIDGSEYQPGVYFYILQAGIYKETRKMHIIR
jgi:hypothetical protein